MVHNVPPAVEVDFLPILQCKDCFRHVIPVLCKAVGENDASTCTDGVEQCGRKEVAAYSGQSVLEGFHHNVDQSNIDEKDPWIWCWALPLQLSRNVTNSSIDSIV